MKNIRRIVLMLLISGALPFPAFGQAGLAGNDLHPVVIMTTSMGPIIITLDAQRAPVTVKNFLSYVSTGFYDSTLVHRVIPGFMIQGGGFKAGNFMQKATNPAILNEAPNGLSNVRGSIAMARGNSLNSATSEFFINLVDNASLDRDRYAVFGQVTIGMETVDKIAKVPTKPRGYMEDVPVKDVVIESIRLSK